MRLEGVSGSAEETIDAGRALGAVLRAGDVLALDGELGAGKTQLVRGIAEGMGLDPAQVSSPTFVVMAEYARPRRGVGSGLLTPLVHIDAYRLAGADELSSLGLDAGAVGGVGGASGASPHGAGLDAVVVVEWAQRVASALGQLAGPGLLARVELAHAPDPTRDAARGPTRDPVLDLSAASATPEPSERRRVVFELPASWALRPGFDELRSLVAALAARNAPDDQRAERLCPITGRPVAPDSPTWPFADERARLADLERWFNGSYRVSRELREDDDAV